MNKLNVYPIHLPINQKERNIGLEWDQAVEVEVTKLPNKDVICDVKYSELLGNVVMVPTKNETWRICVSYKDLNKTRSRIVFQCQKTTS